MTVNYVSYVWKMRKLRLNVVYDDKCPSLVESPSDGSHGFRNLYPSGTAQISSRPKESD